MDEKLTIRKNRIMPAHPTGDEKRIAIVTGTHGDELEGQFVCYELLRRLKAEPGYLKGIVDVYPALNPLGIDSITRGIPMFDLDMNRIFPGNEEGPMMESVVYGLMEDLKGADLCVDIHASNIYLQEIPQVRVNVNTAQRLVPMAKLLNMDFIWVHAAATVLESTLAHSLNALDTPTLVVEMGVGNRLTPAYGDQLLTGLLCLMASLGVWTGPVKQVREPIVSSDHHVSFLNASCPGIFIPSVSHTAKVHQRQELGIIADPLTGEIRQTLYSPTDGLLFTLREYPVVYEGSLIARILDAYADSKEELV